MIVKEFSIGMGAGISQNLPNVKENTWDAVQVGETKLPWIWAIIAALFATALAVKKKRSQ
jgi:hypothetical protein